MKRPIHWKPRGSNLAAGLNSPSCTMLMWPMVMTVPSRGAWVPSQLSAVNPPAPCIDCMTMVGEPGMKRPRCRATSCP